VVESENAHRANSVRVLELLSSGWTYLDVRTVEEFETGHVPGAYNVPIQLGSVAGLEANPDFEACIAAVFPKEQKLIVGCHSGTRSAAAQRRLSSWGYTHIISHEDGWDGRPDAFGRKQGGWRRAPHRVALIATSGRSYAELLRLVRNNEAR